LFLPTFAQSQVGTVTLSVGNGSGPPSSTDNPVQISLDNLDDRTTGVQFDICRGSYLSLSACENTARTPSINCSSIDLGNGCDRILFFSFGGNFIEVGTGPIITLKYDVSAGAPDPSVGYCYDLTLENATVTSCEDDGSGGCTTGPPYANVTLENGQFCFVNPPTCLGVSPGSAMQGDQDVQLVITGENTNFVQGVTQVSFENLDIAVNTTTVDSPTQVTVTVDVAGTAAPGVGDVTVITGTEVIVCNNLFVVSERLETCLSVVPGNAMQDDQDVQVVITGENTNFVQDVTQVTFENTGIIVVDTHVDTPTQVTLIIDVELSAPSEVGDVTVTTGTEIVSCYYAFEVLDKIYEITRIRKSNPTSASMTISWITDDIINGVVHYSINPDLSDFETAYDDRGNVYLDTTHHVSIGNLNPETTYYYEIISGSTVDNNGGFYYSFNTMKVPSEPPPNCPVYGWVYLEDGTTPAEGAVVYLEVVNGGVQSYWISALVNSGGIWVLNLGNLYSTVTDDALPYSDGDPIFLEVQGGSGRTFSGVYAVPAICPLNVGSIILSHFIALDVNLYTGFNLISFPFDPLTDEDFDAIIHTAFSLIAAIPECNEVFSWDALTQRWLSAMDIGGGSYIGDDFPIEAGKGYFVKCTNSATTTFYGKDIAYLLSLTFEPGFNLVSIPYPIDYYTACSLVGAITGSSKSFSWSPTFQKWLSALIVEGDLCIGDNFSIERDEGYFVHSDVHIDEWVPGAGGTCLVDGDCDDGNVCTDDACVASVCQYTNNTAPCDDTLFCNGSDTCSGGSCSSHAGSPCPETECNTCQETTDSCFDLSGTSCTDDGNICTDDQCDGAGTCAHPNNTDPCDDSLYCTQTDECQDGQCIGSDDPCIDNGGYCDGVEYCGEDIADYICSSTGDPCDLALTCDDLNDVCDVSDVTLIIVDSFGYSGTIDIQLDNPLDYVSEVHLDVCDMDLRSWLHIDTESCSVTTRTSDFSCAISDLGGGCVRIDLTTTVSGLIDPSITGPEAIAQLNYTIDANASLVDYADLEPQNIDIQDDTPVSLSVTPVPGRARAVEKTIPLSPYR